MTRPTFCPSCGSTLSLIVQFCEQCGAPVPSAQSLPDAGQSAIPPLSPSYNSGNVLAPLKKSKLRLLLLVPLLIVIYGMFFLAIAAIDKNVTISDNARVLNIAQVRQAAQELPS